MQALQTIINWQHLMSVTPNNLQLAAELGCSHSGVEWRLRALWRRGYISYRARHRGSTGEIVVLAEPEPYTPRRCAVEGCAEPYSQIGYCRYHATQVQRGADPAALRLRPPAGMSMRRKRRLSDDQVRMLRIRRRDGWPLAVLSQRYGLEASTISQIASGKAYRDVA